MWLLNARTQKLEWYYDHDAIKLGYAILSHTWGEEEVNYADIQDPDKARAKKGYQKIEYTCQQALRDGFDYAWVDTCCIDKSSSAELSETIQSMFRWYQKSRVCYAYLPDVTHTGEWGQEQQEKFRSSKWFTRGWTLQELIAPARIKFYGQDWTSIGTKTSLLDLLVTTTGIGHEHLSSLDYFFEASVAAKMSWAAGRQTTRLEDRAYSLMGIFDVNIPLLYGEGERAFRRLQEEIMRTSPDQSILLWHFDHVENMSGLFAASPNNFAEGGNIYMRREFITNSFNITNTGVQLHVPVFREEDIDYLVLACQYKGGFPGPIGLPIERSITSPTSSFAISTVRREFADKGRRFKILPVESITTKAQSLVLSSRQGRPSAHPRPWLLQLAPGFAEQLEAVELHPRNSWTTTTRLSDWTQESSLRDGEGSITWKWNSAKVHLTAEFSRPYEDSSEPNVSRRIRVSYKELRIDGSREIGNADSIVIEGWKTADGSHRFEIQHSGAPGMIYIELQTRRLKPDPQSTTVVKLSFRPHDAADRSEPASATPRRSKRIMERKTTASE